MHRFDELIFATETLTLKFLDDKEAEIVEDLQTSSSSSLVRGLQAIQLQREVLAVGAFSIFEANAQKQLGGSYGLRHLAEELKARSEYDLHGELELWSLAINALKHGRGASYDRLLSRKSELPFRVKGTPDERFYEGDVSEVETLVEVDDDFVRGILQLISRASRFLGD